MERGRDARLSAALVGAALSCEALTTALRAVSLDSAAARAIPSGPIISPALLELTVQRSLDGRFPNVSEEAVRRAVTACFEHTKPDPQFTQLNPHAAALKIKDLLIGTKKNKPRDWKPSPENEAALVANIERTIALGAPIDLFCLYGARKCLGLGQGNGKPDVADLKAVEQMVELHKKVKQFHAPGIKVRLQMETCGEEFYAGRSDCAIAGIAEYLQGMRNLTALIAPGIVEVRGEHEVIGSAVLPAHTRAVIPAAVREPQDREVFMVVSAELYRRFRRYLDESSAVISGSSAPAEAKMRCEALDSFEALKRLKWLGYIPQEQREFYYDRARKELGDGAAVSDLNERVAAYLAAGYARKLCGLVEPVNRDEQGAIAPISFSFVASYPPGTDKALERNVFRRVITSKNIPPWCCRGYLAVNGDRVSVEVEHPCTPCAAEQEQAEVRLRMPGGPQVEISANLCRR